MHVLVPKLDILIIKTYVSDSATALGQHCIVQYCLPQHYRIASHSFVCGIVSYSIVCVSSLALYRTVLSASNIVSYNIVGISNIALCRAVLSVLAVLHCRAVLSASAVLRCIVQYHLHQNHSFWALKSQS